MRGLDQDLETETVATCGEAARSGWPRYQDSVLQPGAHMVEARRPEARGPDVRTGANQKGESSSLMSEGLLGWLATAGAASVMRSMMAAP